MATTQIAYNATTKVVKLQMPGDAPGDGFVDLGDVVHPDEVDVLEWSGNHVLYHHVRDELYKEGEQNMQAVTITGDRVTGLSIAPDTSAKTVGQTQQLTPTFTPATAYNRNLSYVSSDVEIATVDASGLITAVAAGEATITATSTDGGFTDTCVVTVTAP